MVTETVLTGIIVSLLGFIAWRDWHFSKMIEAMSNKLLARDLPEYVRVTKEQKENKTEPKKDQRKRFVDPVLGSQF